MALHRGDDVFRPCLLRSELGQLQDHADGDGVEVGVDEAAAVDTAGAADDLDVDPFAVTHTEAFVDDVLRQAQRLFDTEREVLGVGCPVQPGFLGDEAVDAVAGDHDIRP